jgi:DNA-binding NtrC family response regulator
MTKAGNEQPPIFLVDDEIQLLRSYEFTLHFGGYTSVLPCDDSREVMSLLQRHGASLVLLDLTMPHVSGQELLAKIVAEHPRVPVVVVTGNDDVDTAVTCMKLGATDYLTKPVSKERLLTTVTQLLTRQEIERENERLLRYIRTEELERPEAFATIVTDNAEMKRLIRYAEAVARSREPLLITGETGVGKELLARAIHQASERTGELVSVNIAGLDAHVFDDTLFGHVKGAFTGADRPRRGLVEVARGGTLFFDEIGELALASQVKLLRLLQESEFYPLGRDTPQRADVRVLAATNRSLEELQASDRFRKDLYFRLSTHQVSIPPLRQRLDDLPLLVEHFAGEAAGELGRDPGEPSEELLGLLACYDYPGNVRELRAILYDAISTHESLDDALTTLRRKLGEARPLTAPPTSPDRRLVFGPNLPTIEAAKDLLIEEALRRTSGNKSMAARLLGVTRQALNKRERQKS